MRAFFGVSEGHLDKYLVEFDYRYNTRKIEDGNRTVKAIQIMEGKRLMYQQPIHPNQ